MRGSKYGKDVQLFKEQRIVDIDLGFRSEELDEMQEVVVEDHKDGKGLHYHEIFLHTDDSTMDTKRLMKGRLCSENCCGKERRQAGSKEDRQQMCCGYVEYSRFSATWMTGLALRLCQEGPSQGIFPFYYGSKSQDQAP